MRTMFSASIFIAVSVLLLSHAQLIHGQKQDSPKSAIEGQVLQAGSAEPISGAQFILEPVPAYDGTPASSPGYRPLLNDPNMVISNSEGRFVLGGIDPGIYFLAAIREGFAMQCYGAKRPGMSGCGPSSVLKVEDGQAIKDVVIYMTRGGVISGRITDPGGQPLTGMPVDLRRGGYDATGRKSYLTAPIGTVVTNDRGEYRMYGIDPGRYFILARPPLAGTILAVQPGTLMATSTATETNVALGAIYGPTFYPGVDEVVSDSLIEIQPGSEMNGLNFSVQRLPATKYRIRGRIVDNRPGQSPRSFGYSITPSNEGMSVGVRFYYTEADGTFESPPLVPGSYRVRAQISSPVARPQPGEPPPIFPTLYASTSVEVVSADVEGVAVAFAAPVSISGRLRIEGKDTPGLSGFENTRVRLRRADINSPQPAVIKPDGTFSIENASMGIEYGVTLTGLPPDMYVKEVRNGDIDLLNEPLRISGLLSDSINIVVDANGGRIDGLIRDARTTPAAYVQVVLVPDLHRERRELYKTVTSDAAGSFVFRGIPPGDYKVFAWDDLDPYEYFDDKFISQFDGFSAVHVSESEQQTLDVKLIPSRAR